MLGASIKSLSINLKLKGIDIMKTKILTIILTLTAILSFAQPSEHLLFKGVPIDGTLDEYVSKMEQNGFNHMGTEDGAALLTGDFAGYKGCSVSVSTLKQKDLVYKIMVAFPDKETWSTLSGNYFDLKQLLSEKYGKPSDVAEKFDVQIDINDDNSKMYHVKFDRCKYFSIYETEKGTIKLSIEHDGVSRCFIRLTYLDRTNGNIIKEKAKGDL